MAADIAARSTKRLRQVRAAAGGRAAGGARRRRAYRQTSS